MARVIPIRDVPDEVHDAPVEAARAQGLSLTKYVQRELAAVAQRQERVRRNARVIRRTQRRVRAEVPGEAIVAAIHEGRARR